MMTPEQAEQFCKKIQKSGKYEGDGHEFEELADMLHEYAYMLPRYYKYEFVCDRMSSDEYYELCSEFEADELEGEDEDEE
jgi:hypothetical protein